MLNTQEYLDQKQKAKSWWNTLTYLQKSSMLLELRGSKMHDLMCSFSSDRTHAKSSEIIKLYNQHG